MAEVGASVASQQRGEIDARSAVAGAVGVAGVVGGAKTRAAAGVMAAVSRALDCTEDGAAATSCRETGERTRKREHAPCV